MAKIINVPEKCVKEALKGNPATFERDNMTFTIVRDEEYANRIKIDSISTSESMILRYSLKDLEEPKPATKEQQLEALNKRIEQIKSDSALLEMLELKKQELEAQ